MHEIARRTKNNFFISYVSRGMTIREQSDILSLKFLSDTRTTVVMYRVFLSYNTAPDEMVVVWRLQTLAAASGLHVDVPNPIQRADWPTIMRMIADADSIIAFLTKKASRQVKNEISYAMSRGKPIIPII